MNVIEAAREINQRGPYYHQERGDDTPIPVCKWCGRASWMQDEHDDNCLSLALPAIVAALEGARGVIDGPCDDQCSTMSGDICDCWRDRLRAALEGS